MRQRCCAWQIWRTTRTTQLHRQTGADPWPWDWRRALPRGQTLLRVDGARGGRCARGARLPVASVAYGGPGEAASAPR